MNRRTSESSAKPDLSNAEREGGNAACKYIIKKRCVQKIATFYRNVSKKYLHTYSEELMHNNADNAFDAMFRIENGLLRREPTLSRWEGYFMANTDKWYYAYTYDGETVTVVDACHAQNMHDEKATQCNDMEHYFSYNALSPEPTKE